MISEKTLIDEIRVIKKSIRKYVGEKNWEEAYKASEVLTTLEFIRDWKEG